MERERLVAELKEFLDETFLVDFVDEADADTNVFERGYVDSFGFVDLVAFLETSYSITVTDDDLVTDAFTSVNAMATFVLEKRDGEPGPADRSG